MANLKNFKGVKTHVLLKPVSSPIAIGPMLSLSDVKLMIKANDNAHSIVQDVCKQLDQICCVPLDSGFDIGDDNFVYINPTKDFDVDKV